MKTDDFLELVQPMVLNQGFVKPGARKPTWLVRQRNRQPQAMEDHPATGVAGY